MCQLSLWCQKRFAVGMAGFARQPPTPGNSLDSPRWRRRSSAARQLASIPSSRVNNAFSRRSQVHGAVFENRHNLRVALRETHAHNRCIVPMTIGTPTSPSGDTRIVWSALR